MSNFRQVSYENKNKYSNHKTLIDKEEILLLPQVEEQIITFINKFQLIYEELKSKEKFVNDFEQKFEMINEENKFIKRKIAEEKSLSVKNSQEFTNSIKEKKNTEDFKNSNTSIKLGSTLQKHIEKTIENSDKILKERDEFKEKLSILYKNIEDIKEQLSECMAEREELEILVMNKDKANKNLSINVEIRQKEIKTQSYEKGLLLKSNEELNLKLQDFINKNISLEVKLKASNDQLINIKNDMNHLIEDIEKKENNSKEEIIKLKRKINENSVLHENEKLGFENTLKQKDKDILKNEEEKVLQEKKYKDQICEKENNIKENTINIENQNSKLRILSSELEEEKSNLYNKQDQRKN